ADKTEALARQGLDEALFRPGIADQDPCDIQAGRHCRIGYDTPVPDGADEIILADDALPVADQVIEQVEDLGCDGDDVRPATQLAPVGVERESLEKIAQAAVPLGHPYHRREPWHRLERKE